MKAYKPVVLVVLDGWGESPIQFGNPIVTANLPTIKNLDKYYPKLLLSASGISVGLPWGEMGNSEVGHMTLGSGQIIYQYLPMIANSLTDGSFYNNQALVKIMQNTRDTGGKLHLMGLVSDGGVHAHIDHLLGLLIMAQRQELKEVFIHVIADGRDVAPRSIKNYLTKVQETISHLGIGKIATIAGRYFTMDRNNNWDRILEAWNAMVLGEGKKITDAFAGIDEQYQEGTNDEYLKPMVVTENDTPVGMIGENDGVVFFNYRKDRARQITQAFLTPDKTTLKITPPQGLRFVGFVEYEKGLLKPDQIAFPEQKITTRLGEIISKAGLKQLRIAETEKYAHVTYFFNGGNELPFENEDRMLVKSVDVATYADAPEMSAQGLTTKVLDAIATEKYSFILINYANPDMVSHTGDYQATVKALETVDGCLDQLITAVQNIGGAVLITADHGNAEEVVNTQTGEKNTEHSSNPVPAWLVTPDNFHNKKALPQSFEANALLVDVAPTILELLNLPIPKEMVGRSLVSTFNKS